MEDAQKDSFKLFFRVCYRALSFGFQKEKWLIIGNIVINIAIAVLTLLQLVSFSSIINEIVSIKQSGSGITPSFIQQSILLALSFLVPTILQNVASYLENARATRIGTHLSLHQIDIYSGFDVATIESAEFQTKRDRANKWGTGSINNVIYYSVRIIRESTVVIASGIVLYNIDPILAGIAFIGAVPYYFVEKKYGREIFTLTHVATDESRIEGDRLSYFRDPKKIIETILFKIKNLFRAQVSDIAESFDTKLINIKKRESLAYSIVDIFQTACLLALILFITHQTISGALMVGALFLAFTSYRSFLSALQSLFTLFGRTLEQVRFAQSWFDIFDIKPQIVSSPNALFPHWDTPPAITFKNVSFKYPETEKYVLKNIFLTLSGGEKLAIVGENGAGKTTLVKLLCRVYDPTEGAIYVNDIDLKDINVDHWHSYLGILFQDFTNYRLTIRESIAISRPDSPIDDKKVVMAAEMTSASDFINELPKKYDQLVWKGFQDGIDLSKGQYQRLAVSRILYRDALISVLDEPTSAIDAVAEEKIFEVLEKKMEGRTVILISHRFSTVKNADKIAVIEHGELNEIGSHKDLMKKNGRYAELYTVQANRYLENE